MNHITRNLEFEFTYNGVELTVYYDVEYSEIYIYSIADDESNEYVSNTDILESAYIEAETHAQVYFVEKQEQSREDYEAWSYDRADKEVGI